MPMLGFIYRPSLSVEIALFLFWMSACLFRMLCKIPACGMILFMSWAACRVSSSLFPSTYQGPASTTILCHCIVRHVLLVSCSDVQYPAVHLHLVESA